MAKVKGIFFTFSAFFLVMLVIILSLLVASTLNQSNLRLGESGSLERMYALDVSIERMLADLDNGIEISSIWDGLTQETVFSFTETLDESFADYNSRLIANISDMKDYIEADQPEIQFDLDKISNSEEKVPILIEPSKFRYTHRNKNGKNVLTIYPGTDIYRTLFVINLSNATVDPSDGVEWITQSAGERFMVNITYYDTDNNTDSIEELINETEVNQFRIGDVILTIGELCDNCIELDRNNTNITVNFGNNFGFVGEQVTVNYPRGLYVMNFSDIGIFINATPRII
jgi:hypothetical protein